MQSQPSTASKPADNQKLTSNLEYKDFADLMTKKVEPFYLDIIKHADILAKSPDHLSERIKLLEGDVISALDNQPQLLDTIHSSPTELLAYFGYFACKNVFLYLLEKNTIFNLTAFSILISYANIRHFSAKEFKEDEMFSDYKSSHKEHLYNALSKTGSGKLALLKHFLLDTALLKSRCVFRELLFLFVDKLLALYVSNGDMLYAIHAISRNIDHIYLQKNY